MRCIPAGCGKHGCVWVELEQELGTELYNECGALILAEEGHSTWEEGTIPTFDKLGVP
ncbi:MAG: hypothetical protein CM1200mP20_04300 [Pseudomonadota bacterium]|nr:MAG: hypothetical protein CM1200mP20_04300 [Pseudomonadota bacterium]